MQSTIKCPAEFGTHNCSQITDHKGAHYCVCVGSDTRRWITGEKPRPSDYNPKLIKGRHVIQLREAGLIK